MYFEQFCYIFTDADSVSSPLVESLVGCAPRLYYSIAAALDPSLDGADGMFSFPNAIEVWGRR